MWTYRQGEKICVIGEETSEVSFLLLPLFESQVTWVSEWASERAWEWVKGGETRHVIGDRGGGHWYGTCGGIVWKREHLRWLEIRISNVFITSLSTGRLHTREDGSCHGHRILERGLYGEEPWMVKSASLLSLVILIKCLLQDSSSLLHIISLGSFWSFDTAPSHIQSHRTKLRTS
jgi:hypothetical protein